MGEMLDRLKNKARKEVRFTRGMQCMQRERYLEYLHDMRDAREDGDTKRVGEIAQDLKAFAGEMWGLMVAQQSAYRRIRGMREGHDQPPADSPDTTTPEGGMPGGLIRLVKTRREVQ